MFDSTLISNFETHTAPHQKGLFNECKDMKFRSFAILVGMLLGCQFLHGQTFDVRISGFVLDGYYQAENNWLFIPNYVGLKDSLDHGDLNVIFLGGIGTEGNPAAKEIRMGSFSLIPADLVLSNADALAILSPSSVSKRPRFEAKGKSTYWNLYFTHIPKFLNFSEENGKLIVRMLDYEK